MNFSASFTDPGTAESFTVTWDFGDGSVLTFSSLAAGAMTPSHTYSMAGNYNVSLTVSDGCGGSSSAIQSVAVASVPVANSGGPYAVDEGGVVSLDGSHSSDTGATLSAYDWDFHYDGSTFHAGGSGMHCNFNSPGLLPGDYVVALRVTDSTGRSSMATTTVHVCNVAPVGMMAVPASGKVGVAMNFSGSLTPP